MSNNLGIDPGSRVMGYAVLSEDRGKLIALRCDVIRLVHIENHLDRLNVIFDKVTALLKSIIRVVVPLKLLFMGQTPRQC